MRDSSLKINERECQVVKDLALSVHCLGSLLWPEFTSGPVFVHVTGAPPATNRNKIKTNTPTLTLGSSVDAWLEADRSCKSLCTHAATAAVFTSRLQHIYISKVKIQFVNQKGTKQTGYLNSRTALEQLF